MNSFRLVLTVSVAFVLALSVSPARAATSAGDGAVGRAGSFGYGYSKTVIHLKFRDSARVTLRGSRRFVSAGGSDLQRVNAVLSSKAISKRRLFRAPYERIRRERAALRATKGRITPDLNSYFRIAIGRGRSISGAIRALRRSPSVAEVYAEPLAVS